MGERKKGRAKKAKVRMCLSERKIVSAKNGILT